MFARFHFKVIQKSLYNRLLFLQRFQPGSEDQSPESVKEQLEKAGSGGAGASAGGGGGGGGGGWQSWVTGWYSWYGTDTPDGSADKTQGKDSAAPVFMAEPPTTKGQSLGSLSKLV